MRIDAVGAGDVRDPAAQVGRDDREDAERRVGDGLRQLEHLPDGVQRLLRAVVDEGEPPALGVVLDHEDGAEPGDQIRLERGVVRPHPAVDGHDRVTRPRPAHVRCADGG
ncbi:hypothetical protein [Streptomyces hydrogenans]|uniref:hypothetical protein n=1 Tax=Streptomyces hydrogenans TaxID=1873719 RepID=UPI003808C9D2